MITTAGFSILPPGAHIRPREGAANEALRCHLGLVMRKGCEMRVRSEMRTREEGECLVFGDMIEHEVWHRGETPRAVLLSDFKRG